MPSEQRLHPTTLLFDLAAHAKRFALPAVFVLFGMSQSTGGIGGRFARAPDGWEAWLLVLFVPAVLVSVARYLSFRLLYEPHELVIRSGVLFRTERKIPYSRIQNVDAIQNAVHRLLHVVEVRVETGGGKEEEARLSVLPLAALEELRSRVFASTPHPAPEHAVHSEHPVHPSHPAHHVHPVQLVHLDVKELLLFGFLENKGMVLIAAGVGAFWETGILNRLAGQLFGNVTGRSLFRDLVRPFFDDGPVPWGRLVIGLVVFAIVLGLVRVLSMMWALIRLYDFRLTRVGEDLRSEYGLFTRVAATVPIRRVQTITFRAGPVQRWLERASVRVSTAGGAGTGNQSASRRGREWLAPLIKKEALPQLLQQVVPGFDLDSVNWQPLHPRAFARAVKPRLLVTVVFAALAAATIGWGAVGVAIVLLVWSIIGTRQYVKYVGWAEGDEVVMLRSGWIWQQTTLARVNKIQAVTMQQSPFDRRAAMSGVRVDTAGAGELSHRVAIPFLDQDVARALAGRLSAAAANTAFRW